MDQAPRQAFGGGGGGAGVGLVLGGFGLFRFDWLAVAPGVEALAAFLAEVAARQSVDQATGRLGAIRQGFARRARDVQAHGIGQFQRPHRHAEGHHGGVDGFRRQAFIHAAHGLQHIGRQHGVHEESRRALDGKRQLVDLAHEGAGARGGVAHVAHCVASRVAAHLTHVAVGMHHFHQRHLGHRVEKVDAHQPFGPRQPGAQRFQRQAGRVGGQQRIGLHAGFQ
ncbi:hypothetical protein D3C72_1636940 [compost metagenome]